VYLLHQGLDGRLHLQRRSEAEKRLVVPAGAQLLQLAATQKAQQLLDQVYILELQVAEG
jgi:hypothetical protein